MNSVSSEKNICFIRLNNKPYNYLNKPEFIDPQVVESTIKNDVCKAIVISGVGRHFSAGADKEMLFEMAANSTLKEEIEKGIELLTQLRSYNIPIIACIEGSCFGGGLEIALNADIRIASDKGMFAFPEVGLNVMPGLGGVFQTSKITGKAKALETVLKGDIFSTEQAKAMNLVDYCVDAKTTLDFGTKMAGSLIQDKDLTVVNAVVESIRNAEIMDYSDAIKRETELFCELAVKANKAQID